MARNMTQRSDIKTTGSRKESRKGRGLVTATVLGGLLLGMIGCGGGGGGPRTTGTGTATGTTGTTSGRAEVNLPDVPGQVAVTFLTGAGRAAGDRTAVVRRIGLTDTAGIVESRLQGERNVVLNRYSSQILPLNVPTLGATSRLFTSFEFDVLRFLVEDAAAVGTTTQTFNSVVNLPAQIPANIRVFPGRTTQIPFFADSELIAIDSDTGLPTFSINRFNVLNFRAEDQNVLGGILSDYIAFDLSGMSEGARPRLGNGSLATRVLFSGDNYALSDGDPYAAGAVNFEPLLPIGQADVLIGRLSGPATLPSTGLTPADAPGTYSMVSPNPSDLTGTPRRITGLQGTWREFFRQRQTPNGFTDVGFLRNVGSFVAVTIPSSQDNGRQDMIAATQTIVTDPDGTRRAVVSSCYFGYIDLDQNRFFLYPIKNIYPTDTGVNLSGEVSGTLSGLQYAGGGSPSALRSGSFSVTSGTPVGIPGSGDFVVFRR